MPDDCRYLTVSLQLEQQRLTDWAETCGLLGKGSASLSEHSLQKIFGYDAFYLALNLLTQMKNLVEHFQDKHLKDEHGCEITHPPAHQSSIYHVELGVLMSQRMIFQKLPRRTELLRRLFPSLKSAEPLSRRFMWAAWNKKRFETMLDQLMQLNNAITCTMSRNKQEEIFDMTRESGRSIVQLIDRVEDLEDLVKALKPDKYLHKTHLQRNNPTQLLPESTDADEGESAAEELRALASIKILHRSLHYAKAEEGAYHKTHHSRMKASVLKRDDIQILQSRSSFTASTTWARSEAICKAGSSMKQVWIEWKEYNDFPITENGPSELVLECIERLVVLLQEPIKPSDFRVLRCLGYFVDGNITDGQGKPTNRGRVGLVFEKPCDADQTAEPVSLLQLFEGPQQNSEYDIGPSLTDRMELASNICKALSCLHAVGWLHKGLRSCDILFFRNKLSQNLDLSKPFIMGFSFSRPDARSDMTEKPPRDPKDGLYRHPSALGDSPPQSFQKAYDIYSLGIILMEIALWSSIDSFLNATGIDPKIRRNVRKVLLQDTMMKRIAARVGNRYRNAVITCLDGSLELSQASGSFDDMNALLLSEAFNTSVLKNISGVLC